MKRILLIIICFAFIKTTYSQNDIAFCKAVETGDFNKIERIFKREIKKRKMVRSTTMVLVWECKLPISTI